MSREELVRIDDTGVIHPVGKVASQRMRARKGAFRLIPSPTHVIFQKYVDEDGERDRVRRIMRERGETEERARDAARTPPNRSDYRALREYMLGR